MDKVGLDHFRLIVYAGLLLPSIWVGNLHLNVLEHLIQGKPLEPHVGYSASVALMVIYLAISVLKIWFLSYTMTDLHGLHTFSGCLDVVVFIPSAGLVAMYVLHLQ